MERRCESGPVPKAGHASKSLLMSRAYKIIACLPKV